MDSADDPNRLHRETESDLQAGGCRLRSPDLGVSLGTTLAAPYRVVSLVLPPGPPARVAARTDPRGKGEISCAHTRHGLRAHRPRPHRRGYPPYAADPCCGLVGAFRRTPDRDCPAQTGRVKPVFFTLLSARWLPHTARPPCWAPPGALRIILHSRFPYRGAAAWGRQKSIRNENEVECLAESGRNGAASLPAE
jgi:hypothetical protein